MALNLQDNYMGETFSLALRLPGSLAASLMLSGVGRTLARSVRNTLQRTAASMLEPRALIWLWRVFRACKEAEQVNADCEDRIKSWHAALRMSPSTKLRPCLLLAASS